MFTILYATIIVVVILIIWLWRRNRTKTLYDRLGGVYAIAAVVNHFSDALVNNPIVGRDSPNEQLRDWHRNQLTRLPGLKFMRTLWVCHQAGGPFTFVSTRGSCPFTSLAPAHKNLNITSVEFDEVAAELGRSLDFFDVPAAEKEEVLAVFAKHKTQIVGM